MRMPFPLLSSLALSLGVAAPALADLSFPEDPRDWRQPCARIVNLEDYPDYLVYALLELSRPLVTPVEAGECLGGEAPGEPLVVDDQRVFFGQATLFALPIEQTGLIAEVLEPAIAEGGPEAAHEVLETDERFIPANVALPFEMEYLEEPVFTEWVIERLDAEGLILALKTDEELDAEADDLPLESEEASAAPESESEPSGETQMAQAPPVNEGPPNTLALAGGSLALMLLWILRRNTAA